MMDYDKYEIECERDFDRELYEKDYPKHVYDNQDCNHDCYNCKHRCDGYDYCIKNY